MRAQQRDVMIAITTKQNVTNVLPALQLQVGTVIAIDTATAEKERWGPSSWNLLKKRGIEVVHAPGVPEEKELSAQWICEMLSHFVGQNYNDARIFWNIGGGQKAQQIALWYA